MKHALPIATIAGLFFATGAIAQQTYTDVDDDTQVESLGTDADTVEDMDVYNSAGEDVGEVDEVLGSDEQTPVAVGVDFEDAIAEGERVVQFDSLSMNGDRLTISLDNAAIAALPRYDD